MSDLGSSLHAESEDDSSPASSHFLEICDCDDLPSKFRPHAAQEIYGLHQVGSTLLTIARTEVANLTGKVENETTFLATETVLQFLMISIFINSHSRLATHEMFVSENAGILRNRNVNHSLCAIKRCHNIASKMIDSIE